MRSAKPALVFTLLCLAAPSAHAGVYTDDLSKCLVKSSSPEDQKTLIIWVFSDMALHPAVKPYSAISDAQRDGFTTAAAQLMQRLLTVDCRAETVAALKYEGNSSLEESFTVLGQIAMRGLMSDPDVAKGLMALGKHVDKDKLNQLATEAGHPPP
ncbi:MAG TPA: hypothetical protein VLW75_04365 [Rhizomicrobium sp.]|nr:hypothetical protein [Rhizomicrobium sp.]